VAAAAALVPGDDVAVIAFGEAGLATTNSGVPWELKELLRNLYRTVAPHHARTYLKT
jgi:hypothetical protein